MNNFAAIIIIFVLLLSPVGCFAHPCETNYDDSATSQTFTGTPAQCPLQHDVDDCESTCCCSVYVPLAINKEVPYTPAISQIGLADVVSILPELPVKIYVPPQNYPLPFPIT